MIRHDNVIRLLEPAVVFGTTVFLPRFTHCQFATLRVDVNAQTPTAAIAHNGSDIRRSFRGEDYDLSRAFAREVLLEAEDLYAKYLLIAATLAEKTDTGATDVNKFYGLSAPNFLKVRA